MIAGLGIILILAMLGPIMSVGDDQGGGQMTGAGNILRQAAYLFAMALIVVAVRPIHHPRRLLAIPLAMVVALAWCWLSLAWAIDPGIAFRRLLLTTLVIWGIFVAVRQLGYDETLRLVRILLVVLLVANFAAVLIAPQIGTHTVYDALDPALVGNWRGVMQQKNFAGLSCALTVIVFVLDARRIHAAIRIVVVAAALFFLIMSVSRTSLGAAIVALAIGLIFNFYNARYRAFLIPLLIVALVTLVAVNDINSDPVSAHLGDNQTLTGRPEIWRMLFAYSADHPLAGSGYGSFWNIGPESPVYQYGHGWITTLAVGHNGFIDLLVQLGIPGVLLVIFAVFIWPTIRLLTNSGASGSRGALIIAMLIFCLAHNMTESSLFDRDAIGQVFLMLAIAMLCAITPTLPRGRLIARGRRGDREAPEPAARSLLGL